MTSSHSKVAAVMLLSLALLAQLTNSVHGKPVTKQKLLERVIREAKEESKQLANDINNWMNEQSLDKEGHLRVRKSVQEENDVKAAEIRGRREKFDSETNFTATRRRREAPKNGGNFHLKKAGHSNTGTTKGRPNPVLRAFDLMKLLISEREKSLKKSKVRKTDGKVKIGRRLKQSKAVKREKSLKQKKMKNYSSRSAASNKKFKVVHRSSSGKLASHSDMKQKPKSRRVDATQTRNVVQILKAMPRKQLRNLLKEKGLGKFWNVVKVAPKESVKRKFHGKNVTGKMIKGTHGKGKGRKDGKKSSKRTRSDKRAQVHKRTSKSYRKAAPKRKQSKISATDDKPSVSQNDKKRSKILRPPTKVHNFQGKGKDSRKRKEVRHANHKFAALKDKIKQTNELKFKVAKALLAHCATENKLRNIFHDINMSLKKAAVLVEIIGRKLGMEKGDIQKITKEHPEKAVQQFLSEVF